MKFYTAEAVNEFVNENSENIVDIFEGTLLDSYILNIDNCYILIMPHVINHWQSKHIIFNFDNLEDCYNKLGINANDERN